ncbi:MAG: acetyltransferase [Rhodomicrobium sp.]|nr:MAG: acetyltransferase [Rhodomicrobium sp.]
MAADVIVRKYRQKDAGPLCVLVVRSVKQVASYDYSADQVRVWADRVPSRERMDDLGLDGRLRFVAVDLMDEPVGFADLERNGHIGYFYCAPEVVGTGVGRALYEALEKEAVELGLKRLFVEASETAKPFFIWLGFSVDHKREFEIERVPIHNWAMVKLLSAS